MHEGIQTGNRELPESRDHMALIFSKLFSIKQRGMQLSGKMPLRDPR